MTDTLKKVFGYSTPFLLTALFIYLSFKDVELAESIDLISKMSILWFFVFYIFHYLAHIVRAFRWKIIVKSIKKDTSLLNMLGATMIGYGVNYAVPRLGEIYRPFFLGKWEGISRSALLGTIVVERIIDIIVLGFSTLLSVYVFPGNLFEEIEWLKPALLFGGLVMGGVVIFLYLVVHFKENFYNTILSFVGRFSKKIADKLAYIFHMLVDGFSTVKTLKNWTYTIGLSVIIMLLYGLTSYQAFLVLRMEEIIPVSLAMGWVVMTISAFGIVIPTVGGTGSYHIIVISILAVFGFSNEVGMAYALFTHTVASISFIVSTIFFVFYINHRRAKIEGASKETFFSVFKIDSEEK
ncbi:MAG: flippase-like domain-containing protein [Melioribacteraceae bacterium]|nr:flippase-like domain-containing protein [Melioribacteraceae bacterium]